ncbi:hypothetical protein CH381_25435 [Leptospira sp. mixed culture ATI2-C-A1]|nr:hypothetical protein CH381_25435 [Leptospira sp. mixed culture ATI2-C-A1]
MNKFFISINIFYFLFYLIDFLLYIVPENSLNKTYILYHILILYPNIFYGYILFLLFSFFYKIIKKQNLYSLLVIFTIFVTFEYIKIALLNKHTIYEVENALSIPEKNLTATKREEYAQYFRSHTFQENQIFINDRLEENILSVDILSNIKIKFGKTHVNYLKSIFENNFNLLSFISPQEYNTEYGNTKFDKLVEISTENGKIVFFVFNSIIQNCIFNSELETNNILFIKHCHQKQEYFEVFWNNKLKLYCSQRSIIFQNSNICDKFL